MATPTVPPRRALQVLLEKKPAVGGVWSPDGGWANSSSRVQIMEPTYRLRADDDTADPPTDFT
jgi:hypothetical protein